MKSKKILMSLVVASTGILAVVPVAVNAADSGVSTAEVDVKDGGPKGSISFVDIETNAKINFADTTLGANLTALEKIPGAARIKLLDNRENLAVGKDGAYTVQIKYNVVDNDFSKNGLGLNLASSDTGLHTHKATTVSNDSQIVFSGIHNQGVADKEVILNPTLSIPTSLTTAGEYSAQLLWTLVPEI